MKLTHPNGGSVETTRDKAEPYLSQGWVEVKAAKKAAAKPKPKPEGE